jgi:hypothetical protein
MLPRLRLSLLLALFGIQAGAQSPAPRAGPIDSVVLVRIPAWPCSTCAPERVTLGRNVTDTVKLAAFGREADSLGFYRFPTDFAGSSFCRVVRSDALMATLSIYHRDGWWSVRGYHGCRDRSPEQAGLLVLEAMVDSLAARAGR